MVLAGDIESVVLQGLDGSAEEVAALVLARGLGLSGDGGGHGESCGVFHDEGV